MSIAVVGTDTEVGKTVVSAVLVARYGPRHPVGYWKPIATGRRTGRDVTVVREWVGHCGVVEDECYLFDPPVSPHLAARQARRRIAVSRVVDVWHQLLRENPSRRYVVEGIGGVLVPIDRRGTLLADVVKRLRLPCLVVARSTLGTINHTLLTLEALRRRRISVIGVVLNGPRNAENHAAVRHYGRVPIVGEVTPMRAVTRRSVARMATRFDRRGLAKPYLT